MAYSGTLGAMLQGVSQQPAYLRGDGMVTEQINWLPDATEGITTRPGSEHIARVSGLGTDIVWQDVFVGGKKYFLGFQDNLLVMVDTAGVQQTIQGPSHLHYMGTDMTTYVYDDEIYIANRTRTVETSNAGSDVPTHQDNWYVTFLGGQFNTTYTLIAELDNGATVTTSYTTPDGSANGHSAQTTSTHIAEQLSAGTNANANFAASRRGSVIRVVPANQSQRKIVSLRCEDGTGNDSIRVAGPSTETVENLPEIAVHQSLIKITGENASADDMWMIFDMDDTDIETVDPNWGGTGVWREWFNPAETHQLDRDTMPHKLVPLGNDTWNLQTAPWQGRRTGDADTNPMPSFVGSTIRDIGGFQSRLVLIAKDAVVMSRTNIPVDFFKKSAAQEISSDPIDMISTSESSYTLDWIMPFDRDLIIMGDGSQFIISGGGALTPSNASMVESTNFVMQSDVRPVNVGRSVLFPFQSGSYSGIKEFLSSANVEGNEAVTLTKVQDRYIRGSVTGISASNQFSLVLFKTNDTVDQGTIYAYQYFFDGEAKAQNAWFKLTFPVPVAHVLFDDSSVYVLLWESGDYVLTRFDLDIPMSDGIAYNASLDDIQLLTAGDAGLLTTTVNAQFVSDNLVAIQSTGCAIPGQTAYIKELVKEDDGTVTVHLDAFTVPDGAEVYVGVPMAKTLKPTMPLFRDREGNVISNTKLVVSDFHIYFENSGYMDVVMSSKYRTEDVVMSNQSFPLGDDPDDPERDGLSSGIFSVPWGERSDWSELAITSTDVRPITITEVEWIGQILTRGVRD